MQNGRTALHRACDGKHLDIVQVLVKSGADPDIKDEGGMTALDLARSEGSSKIRNYLHDDLVKRKKDTIFDHAKDGDLKGLDRILATSGFDVNSKSQVYIFIRYHHFIFMKFTFFS